MTPTEACDAALAEADTKRAEELTQPRNESLEYIGRIAIRQREAWNLFQEAEGNLIRAVEAYQKRSSGS